MSLCDEPTIGIDLSQGNDTWYKAEVIVSGNCVVCGKQLDCKRLFVCEQCESKFQLT